MARRIALLADIHANVWALEAVLADIRAQHIDSIWNLGDILHGALRPRATYELLQRADVELTIRGNQDRELLQAADQKCGADPAVTWMLRDLGPEPIEWLRGLPATAVFESEVFESEALLCHGSPADDLCYLLEDVSSGHPLVRKEHIIAKLLAGTVQPLVVCGHTHIPRLARLAGGQTIVNPGSVGLPAYRDDQPVSHAMETYSPDASYAILEKTAAGWSPTLRKVPYDTREASRSAAELGRPDWAYQIATGRVARRPATPALTS